MAGSVSIFSSFDLMAGILNITHLRAQQKALMSRVVLAVEGEVKKVTPVRTGNLRRSVTGAVRSPVEGVVGSNLVYAPIVHRTNPYLDIGYANAEGQIDGLFRWFADEVVDRS
jgi:hypothetical protein